MRECRAAWHSRQWPGNLLPFAPASAIRVLRCTVGAGTATWGCSRRGRTRSWRSRACRRRRPPGSTVEQEVVPGAMRAAPPARCAGPPPPGSRPWLAALAPAPAVKGARSLLSHSWLLALPCNASSNCIGRVRCQSCGSGAPGTSIGRAAHGASSVSLHCDTRLSRIVCEDNSFLINLRPWPSARGRAARRRTRCCPPAHHGAAGGGRRLWGTRLRRPRGRLYTQTACGAA